jgi:hypothetical protein
MYGCREVPVGDEKAMNKFEMYVQDEIKLSQYENYILIPFKSREVAENAILLNNDKGVDLSLKRHREHRSLDANAYMWVLCGKLAEVVGNTDVECYQEFIKRVGVRQIFPLKTEAVKRFVEIWENKGKSEKSGWICETMPSKLDGFTNVVAYYGSSEYNTKEMSRLIDEIVSECKEHSIETMPPAELNRLKNEWRDKE